jgi:hypothetical protein
MDRINQNKSGAGVRHHAQVGSCTGDDDDVAFEDSYSEDEEEDFYTGQIKETTSCTAKMEI